jgi:hypothetical protein
MSEADVAVEFHFLLWMIGVVFAANLVLGILQNQRRPVTASLIQATAFTAVGMLARSGLTRSTVRQVWAFR